MAGERKRMTFNMDRAAPVAITAAAPAVKLDATERQQVGARVTKEKYRQLKARAALTGATVQALVEQAIDEYLAKPSS
jgi:predicted HicB family RNase H-like nuclease